MRSQPHDYVQAEMAAVRKYLLETLRDHSSEYGTSDAVCKAACQIASAVISKPDLPLICQCAMCMPCHFQKDACVQVLISPDAKFLLLQYCTSFLLLICS